MAPLYLGNGVMGNEFDPVFEAVLSFCVAWVQGDENRRRALDCGCPSLAVELNPLFRTAVDQLRKSDVQCDDNEELRDRLASETLDLPAEFPDLFAHCWKAKSTATSSEDWGIDHSPGLSWSGTTFWASDARACASGIRRRVIDHVEAIQALVKQAGFHN